MIEKDGVWYVNEIARDFFEEMAGELRSIGWEIVGEASIDRVTVDGKTYCLETRVQRYVDLGGQ